MEGEEGANDGRGKLEPWYAQGGEGEKIDEVDKSPFAEEVEGTAIILKHLYPVIKAPG